MANLPELPQFDPVYQLERTDPVDAGIGGSGIDNLPLKNLTNRTRFLKDRSDNRVNFYVDYANQTIPASTIKNANGSAYVLDFPMAIYDYATPNDGITRNYMIDLSMTAGAGFTFNGTDSVRMSIITTIAGPTLNELVGIVSFNSGQTISARKRVTLPPNTQLRGVINVGSVSASVPVTAASFHIEEII